MVNAEIKTIGVKEFRENLAQHLMSPYPIAVTKHGLTLGYYLPTHPVSQGDRQTLTETSKQLQQVLEARGIDLEEAIKEAQELRRTAKRYSNV